MSKLNVSLNGSNVVNPERKKAFQEALADDHRINGKSVHPEKQSPPQDRVEIRTQTIPSQKEKVVGDPAFRAGNSNKLSLGQVVDQAYKHQSRTMDIHQQFIEQQTDHIDLLTNVLAQQNKAMQIQDPATTADLVSTFQKTLDNLHQLREKSVAVHNAFLSQQSDFSDRILRVLNGKSQSVEHEESRPQPAVESEPTWVVHNPPIILDGEIDREPKPTAREDDEIQKDPESRAPGAIAQGIGIEQLAETLLQIVAEKTGYPAEMLELEMDMEADLGIDSIKRVEILSSLEEAYPELPPADTNILASTRTLQEIVSYMESAVDQPPASDTSVEEKGQIAESAPALSAAIEADEPVSAPQAAVSSPELIGTLLEIVSEKTGYPVEMLEESMDMEADLGIDSIKRVEILSSLEEKVPGLPSIEAGVLAELRTIGQIAELMNSRPSSTVEKTAASQGEKKKDPKTGPMIQTVKVKHLPKPDALQFDSEQIGPVIIASDGSEHAANAAQELEMHGLKPVLWIHPSAQENMGPDADQTPYPVISPQERTREAYQAGLARLADQHGAPAGFIHFHPTVNGNQLLAEGEPERVKEVFFMASELKEEFLKLDPPARNFFLTVTRMDGFLGLKSNGQNPSSGGLSGLVKSLSWEWPEVFCRSIDIDPNLDPNTAGAQLLAELLDPDRSISEVGVNADGRVTLTADAQDDYD